MFTVLLQSMGIKVSLVSFLDPPIYISSHVLTHNHTLSDKLRIEHLAPAVIIPQ